MKKIAYLSIGSNSNDAREMLQKAVYEIQKLNNSKLIAISKFYYTEPQEYHNQPWFANQVLKIAIAQYWKAEDYMRSLLDLETKLGRDRSINTIRFGPRKIDIDLLLYDNEISSNPQCILPHPRMTRRAFVLVPLRELEPDLKINGKTITELLNMLTWHQSGEKIFQ